MPSRLLIDEPPLLVIPGLAKIVGLDGAIIMQQVHYLTNPEFSQNHFQGRHWVWKTYEQWVEMLPFWSKSTIQRVIRALEEEHLLIVHKRKNKSFKNVKFYSINYDCLDQVIDREHSKNSPEDPSCGEELVSNDVRSCKVNPDTDVLTASSSPEEGQASRFSLNEKSPSSPKPIENKGSHRHGQIDHVDGGKSNGRCGQVDHMQVVNLTTPYMDKITRKDLPLPQTPSPTIEEEEDFNHKSLISAESMIALWNKTVQTKLGKKPVQLPKSIFPTLTHTLKSHFNDDLSQWKSYCDQIEKCKFLMTRQESGFQVHFHWAINPDNITKVLNDAYYDKPEEEKPKKELPWAEYVLNLHEYCQNQHASNTWFEFCKALAKKVGPSVFDSWFLKMKPKKLGEEGVILAFPTRFIAHYVENNFHTPLRRSLESIFPKLQRFEIIHDSRLKEESRV